MYPELFPKLPLIIFARDSSLEETVISFSHFERLISLAVRGHIMWLKKNSNIRLNFLCVSSEKMKGMIRSRRITYLPH